jgi:hypothetical protein
MTQISSSASLSSRPRIVSAEAAPESRPEPGDGFSDLLAGLLSAVQPMPPQPVRASTAAETTPETPAKSDTASASPDGDRPSGSLQQSGGRVPDVAVGGKELPSAAEPGGASPAQRPESKPLPGAKPSAEARAEASIPDVIDKTPKSAAAAPRETTPPVEKRRGAARSHAERPISGSSPVAAAASAMGTREHAAGPTRTATAAETTAVASSPASMVAPTHSAPTYLLVGQMALAGLAWQGDSRDSAEPPIGLGLAASASDVAIGSAERTAATEPATAGGMRPVTQLAAAVERAVNGEVRQLTVQLSPSELGTIEIALEIDADRRLGIAILVERPETLDMLRQETRQLERLLAQQGIALGDAGLELGLMSQERRDDGQRASQEGREMALAEAMTAVEPAAQPMASPRDPLSPHRVNLSI